MRDTKKEILNTALKLFNQYGFSEVTIRMIAKEMNISSGNLNYHFKKREDIFEALYFEMVAHFDKRVEDLTIIDFTLSKIENDIKESMLKMLDYKFFWTDIYRLIEANPKVKKHFKEAYLKRINGCFFLFDQLISNKIMKSIDSLEEKEYLAERMVQYGNTWLYSSSLNNKAITQKTINHYVNVYLSMLMPYLK